MITTANHASLINFRIFRSPRPVGKSDADCFFPGGFAILKRMEKQKQEAHL
jgi:hypothetical protein